MSARWPSQDAGRATTDGRYPLAARLAGLRGAGATVTCGPNDAAGATPSSQRTRAGWTTDTWTTGGGVWVGVARLPRASKTAAVGWPGGRSGGTKSVRACRDLFVSLAGELARTRPGGESSLPRMRLLWAWPRRTSLLTRPQGREGGRGGEARLRAVGKAALKAARNITSADKAAELPCRMSLRPRPRLWGLERGEWGGHVHRTQGCAKLAGRDVALHGRRSRGQS